VVLKSAHIITGNFGITITETAKLRFWSQFEGQVLGLAPKYLFTSLVVTLEIHTWLNYNLLWTCCMP